MKTEGKRIDPRNHSDESLATSKRHTIPFAFWLSPSARCH
jgi:hypothetical protein